MACDIFISYRRLDSAVFSQWLAQQLRMAYGHESVFIDTENIRVADVWAAKIAASLTEASLVIVVIGKSWLSVKDEFERRRIDRDDDWVRREIEMSLQQNKKILPILIDGAEIPASRALPPSLAGLTDAQAHRFGIERIAKDISDFVVEVGTLIKKQPAAAEIQYPYPLLRIAALDEQNLNRLATTMPQWRVVNRRSGSVEKVELMRTYEFESFSDVMHFMNTAARFIDRIDHHPDWTNVWRTLVVHLTTWDIGHKPSMLDVDLATYLDDLYRNYVRKIASADVQNASVA